MRNSPKAYSSSWLRNPISVSSIYNRNHLVDLQFAQMVAVVYGRDRNGFSEPRAAVSELWPEIASTDRECDTFKHPCREGRRASQAPVGLLT